MPTIANLVVDVDAHTSKFSKGLRVAGAGLAALATGAAFAFKKFEEAEQVSRQTDAVIKSTGGAAKVTASEVEALAQALSEKSGVDDEVIQSGQNMLLTFKNIRNEAGRNNDIFDRTTKTLVDFAVAMDREPRVAAIQLGKALNDPVAALSALGRSGVQFSDKQEQMIKTMAESGDLLGAQKIILRELDSQFGGSAAAQRTASAAMSVALENLAETIGGLVAPAFTFLLEAATDVVNALMDAGPMFQGVINWLRDLWKRIQPVVTALGTALAGAIRDVWTVIVTNLWPALQDLIRALQPVFKIVVAVAGVAFAALIKALPIATRLLAAIISVFAKVVTAVGKVVQAIQVAASWIRDRFVAAWQFLRAVVTNVWNGIKAAAIGAINFVIQQLNRLIGAVNRVQDVLDTLAGPGINFENVGTIPELHSGGTVTRTGLAMVHRGEEFSGVGRSLPSRGQRSVLHVDRRRFAGAMAYDSTFRGW